MIIIASAAYVGAEFQVEFGKIPPCMLPIGNCRLVEHQIAALRAAWPGRAIVLSLPERYELPGKDRDYLDAHAVERVPVPEGLTLADSLVYVINAVGVYEGPLVLLHGDTLVHGLPDGADAIGVARTRDDYNWEVEQSDDAGPLVWCGWFAFAHLRDLVRALSTSRGAFVDAVRRYDRDHPMRRAEPGEWFDLGHVNTYFNSRARMTTQRVFNALSVAGGSIVKTGHPAHKIRAEAAWFLNLPPALKVHAPQLIEHGDLADGTPFYRLEYLCLAPLNELFVHGRNPPFFWKKLFMHCAAFLALCHAQPVPVPLATLRAGSRALLGDKTLRRLATFAAQRGIDTDAPTAINGIVLPGLRAIAQHCAALAAADDVLPGLVHGDLCFSNILFDSRADALKVIDPRGLDHDDRPARYGDLRYDLAKLSHSVLGLYDFIIAGAYRCERLDGADAPDAPDGTLAFRFEVLIDPRIVEIQHLFLRQAFPGALQPLRVMPLTVLLFLSMLPLHADDALRQQALLANALRLYAAYIAPTRADAPTFAPVQTSARALEAEPS